MVMGYTETKRKAYRQISIAGKQTWRSSKNRKEEARISGSLIGFMPTSTTMGTAGGLGYTQTGEIRALEQLIAQKERSKTI